MGVQLLASLGRVFQKLSHPLNTFLLRAKSHASTGIGLKVKHVHHLLQRCPTDIDYLVFSLQMSTRRLSVACAIVMRRSLLLPALRLTTTNMLAGLPDIGVSPLEAGFYESYQLLGYTSPMWP